MIATRDLEPTDLILRDTAVVVSPYTRSSAQCLQCSRKISNNHEYTCHRCGFPMCDEQCAAGDLHKVECRILEAADFEADIEELEDKDDHYACIMPLRYFFEFF